MKLTLQKHLKEAVFFLDSDISTRMFADQIIQRELSKKREKCNNLLEKIVKEECIEKEDYEGTFYEPRIWGVFTFKAVFIFGVLFFIGYVIFCMSFFT